MAGEAIKQWADEAIVTCLRGQERKVYMKKTKRIFAILMSLAMILTMSIAMSATAFAAAGDRQSDTTISVTDLKAGDVVTPYQVIEWKDGEGWAFKAPFNTLTAEDLKEIIGTPAVPASGSTPAKPAVPGKITQAMANKIAALASGGTGETLSGTTWSKSNPAPGLYMVAIAAKESGVVYNPAFVGADFESGNTTNTISITATYSDTAVAKKSTITTLKTVDANEDSDEIKAAKASMVGDIVSFKITTTIPVFLDSYKNPSFKLTDEISDGMKLKVDADHPIKVKYGNVEATCTAATGGDSNVTITKDSDTKYTAEFDKDYLDANAVAVPVEVTYFAEITNAATFNVNRDDNTVTVEYSNGPNEEKGVEKDVTNHYTFSIGASIIGKQGKKGYEAVKVGVDEDGNELTELTEVTLNNGDDTDTARALAGATFELYRTSDNKKIGEFTTGADGIITFEGLDADTYYLKETKAPDGYIMTSQAQIPVVITATYEKKDITETVNGMEVKYETSVLKDYTVTIDGHATKYEFNNEGETLVDPVIKDITTDEARIANTKGQPLPSTGGIGTIIFYTLGTLLVIGCGIVLVSRRRMQKDR